MITRVLSEALSVLRPIASGTAFPLTFKNSAASRNSLRVRMVLLLVFTLLIGAGVNAQGVGTEALVAKKWTGLGGNAAWTTAGNWSPSAPVAGDSVVIDIPAGTITAVPAISLQALTIAGSCTFDLTGQSATVTVNGNFSVASGVTFGLTSKVSLAFASSAITTINGTLNTASNFTANNDVTIGAAGLINGTGAFALSAGATLRIGSVNGIVSGNTASGNIQVTGTRTYDLGANYVYNGTAAQSTGDGIPTGLTGSLTIDNPTTVSLTAAKAISTGTLNLTQGTFAAGTLLTMGNSITAANATINRSEGTITGTLQGSNWYNINYTGNSKTVGSGAAMSGAGFRNATVNLNSGQSLSLTTDITIPGVLTLSSGNINTGSFKVIVSGTSAASISGGSAPSHIIGNLQRAIAAGGGTYAFPIGAGGVYSPANLNFGATTVTGSILGSSTATENPNLGTSSITGTKSVNRFWSFSIVSGLATAPYTATFNWDAADNDADFEFNNTLVGRYATSTWTYPVVASKTATSVQVTGLTGFGDFAVGNCTPAVITSQPSTTGQNVCLNGTLSPISVSIQGTASYQWYSNTTASTTGGTLLSGATSSSYTPASATAGTLYYYVVITNSPSCSITSNVSGAITVNTLPAISSQPASAAAGYCVGATASALSVTATAGSGSITKYEWYSNTSSSTSGGTLLATNTTSSTTNTFTPSTAAAGTLYYYVVVTNSNSCTVSSALSGAITTSAVPTTANAGADQVICGSTSATLSANTPATGTGAWSIISGTAGTVTGTSNATSTFTGTVGTSYTLRWTISNGACTPSTDDVVITFNSGTAGPTTVDASICTGGTGSVSVSSTCPVSTSTLNKAPGAGAGTGWTSPANILINDNSYATVSIASASSTSALTATGFNFNIPANATIVGIQTSISRFGTNASLQDNNVSLLKSGVTSGNNKAAVGTGWPTAEAVASYGTVTDLWGTTWTPADINAANFGLSLIVSNTASSGAARTASVDYIDITVTYTQPGTVNWYTVSSGGTVIGTGASFNPVGVANSGLANTNTAGTYTYFAECSTNPGCRSAANFVIKPSTVISAQPQSVAICPGTTTVLSVTAIGENLSYEWKNGGSTIGTNQNSYTANEGGKYNVTVTGTCGSVNSDTATVTFNTATNILVDPVGDSICAGSSKILTVTAEGTNLSYQWMNGTQSVGTNSSSYTATAPGTYYLLLNGTCGKDTSASATITTRAATSIIIQPLGDTVCPGSTVSLNVIATGSGDLSYQWKLGDDNIAGANTSTYEATQSGNYTVTVTGACDALTSSAASVSYLTATAINAEPMNTEITYGDTAQFSLAASGEELSYRWQVGSGSTWSLISTGAEYLSVSGPTLSLLSPTVAPTGDNYKCVVSGKCGQDTSAVVSITVRKATLVLTANDTMTYGDVSPVLAPRYSGFKRGESLSDINMNGSPILTSMATPTSDVATYDIIIDSNNISAPNYNFLIVKGKHVVNKAVLDVAAMDTTREYGENEPVFTPVYTGFKNGQDIGSINFNGVSPLLSTTTDQSSPVAEYTINASVSGLASTNYTFRANAVKGKLRITPAKLSVSAADTVRTYGDANPLFTALYNGFKNAEKLADIGMSGAPVFNTIATVDSGAGEYDIDADITALQSPNYIFLPRAQKGKLTIAKAMLDVAANDTTSVYGDAIPVFTPVFEGFKRSQMLADIAMLGDPVLSTIATKDSGAGDYEITADVAGLSARNYNFRSRSNKGKLTIGQATLTVAADDAAREYGEANPSFVPVYSGFRNEEDITRINLNGAPGLTTTATIDSAVGVYAIAADVSAMSSRNYKFAARSNKGMLTIGQATISVAALNEEREYGEANPTFTPEYAGFRNGEDVTKIGMTGVPELTTTATIDSAVGIYDITAQVGGLSSKNYKFIPHISRGKLTIKQATLTVAAQDEEREYGLANPAFTPVYAGFRNGEDITTINKSGDAALSTLATIDSAVGSYEITANVSAMSARNYKFAPRGTKGKLTIGQATLTVAADDAAREYGEANPSFVPVYSGFRNEEDITRINLNGAPGLTTTATIDSAVGVYAIAADVSAMSSRNYKFAARSNKGMLTIGQATISVAALNEEREYGEANPTFTPEYAGFRNGEDVTKIGMTGVPELTTTATIDSAVGIYDITAQVGGLSSKNYKFIPHISRGKLTIKQATLTVVAQDEEREYGLANPAFTPVYAGFRNGEDITTINKSGDAALSTLATIDSAVGSYEITANVSAMSARNYKFAPRGTKGKLTIGQATLTVAADDAAREYGEANPSFVPVYSGFRNEEDITRINLNGAPGLTTTATIDSAVGVYAIAADVSAMSSRNYKFAARSNKGMLTIGQATISVAALNEEREYGEANPTFTPEYAGFRNGEDVTKIGMTGVPELTTTATIDSAVGIYDITAQVGGLSSKNYKFIPHISRGKLTIKQATLTVAAQDEEREYGLSNPTFTPVYDGFRNSEDITKINMNGAPVLSTAATIDSAVGVYDIAADVTALSSRNYKFMPRSFKGKLTIGQATLTVTGDDQEMIYGDALPDFTSTLGGFRNADDKDNIGLTGLPGFSTIASSTSDTGSYVIATTAGSLASRNYKFISANGTLHIGQATLLVAAKDTSREYGLDNPSFIPDYAGFKNGEKLADIGMSGGEPQFTTSATVGSPVGAYDIMTSVAGLSSKNYAFVPRPFKGLLHVTQATLTVAANDTEREYGVDNPSFTPVYDGFRNSEDITKINMSGAPGFTTTGSVDSAVGVYAISADVSALGSLNYKFVPRAEKGKLTIGQATITVAANDATREYGLANPSFTPVYAGFRNNEDITKIDKAGDEVFTTGATIDSAVGVYAISADVSAMSARNYRFAARSIKGNLTIGQATLTVAANDESREYGLANPSFTPVYAGFRNNEDITKIDKAGDAVFTTSATIDSAVGVYEVTADVSAMNARNYAFAVRSNKGLLTIGQATLTVTGDDKEMIYGDVLPGLTSTLSGFRNADNKDNIGLTGLPGLTTTASSMSDTGSYVIATTTGSLASRNYKFISANGALHIGQATLLVAAKDTSREYGLENPSFIPDYAGFRNGEQLADIGMSGGEPQFTTSATVGSPVGAYDIVTSVAGLSSKNYAIVPRSFKGVLNVTQATLTVAASDASREYGLANPTFTPVYAGFRNSEDITKISKTGEPSFSTAATITSDVDVYDITADVSALSSKNYQFVTRGSKGTLTVGQATLTVAANNETREYGVANPTFTPVYAGFRNSEDITKISKTGEPSFTTAATITSDVDVYDITADVSALSSKNYKFVARGSKGTLTVGQATLTVAANNETREYGVANPTFTPVYAGFRNSEDITKISKTGEPSFTTAATITSDVDVYDITADVSALSSKNYKFVARGSKGTLTVGQATLTVAANNETREYGVANPTFTPVYAGFRNSEDITKISKTGEPSFSTAATITSDVDVYDITADVSALSSKNYQFVARGSKGTLTVGQATLTVAANNETREYGVANPTFTPVYAGFRNSEDITKISKTGEPSFSTAATITSDVDVYDITADVSALSSKNYQFVTRGSKGTLTVGQATLTVAANNETREYGVANPTFTPVYAGFRNSEDITKISKTGEPSFSTAATITSDVDVYDITADVSALSSKNYQFVTRGSKGTLTVGQATLTVAANNETREYGVANPTFTPVYAGFRNSEDITKISKTGEPSFSTAATITSDVDVYDITADVSALSSKNYKFVTRGSKGTLTVGQATLTVAANNETREYGVANPTFTPVYAGFRNSEDITKISKTGEPSFSTAATITSDVDVYDITADVSALSSKNYKFVARGSKGTLTVGQAILTVAASDASREYGLANPTFTPVYAGFRNSEDITKISKTGEPSFTTAATITSDVDVYDITADVSALSSKNYQFVARGSKGTLTVGQATLTVAANNETREYGVANPTFTPVYAGFRNSEDITKISKTGEPSFTTAATITSDVDVYDITADVSALSSKNYQFVARGSKGTLTVGQATLTVAANNETREYGVANPTFTPVYAGFRNSEDITKINKTGEPSMATTATIISSTGVYDITTDISALSSKNYVFVARGNKGTLTIGKATITVAAVDATREYGEENPVFSPVYNGFRNDENLASIQMSGTPSFSTQATKASDAGSYTVEANVSALSSGNYVFAPKTNKGTLIITKAPLTVTANDTSRNYGSLNPAFTATLSGFKNGQTVSSSGISGAVNFTTPATQLSPVNVYDIMPDSGTLVSKNYRFQFAKGKLTINKAQVTVIADNKSKYYGEVLPQFTTTFSGFVNGEDLGSSGITGTPALSTDATASSPVDLYDITIGQGNMASSNYTFLFKNGTLVVRRATITVRADSASRIYGDPNPVFTASYSGFVNNESLASSGITGTPKLTTQAVATSPVGSYVITAETGSLVSTNYSFTFVNNKMSVTKALLTIRANDTSKIYGIANPAFTASYTGFKNNETLASSSITGAVALQSNTDALTPVGVYDITPTAGTLASDNYIFNYVNGKLSIGKATLTVTADNKNKIYGAVLPQFTATISGFKNGEVLTTSGITGTPALSTVATTASAVGLYDIVSAPGSLASDNYNFVYNKGTLVIGKAGIVVTAEDKSKTYGQANPTLTVTYNGFVNGENLQTSGIIGAPSITTPATASSNAGTYDITAAPGTLASGNYSFTYVKGAMTIGKASLTIRADNKGRTYGDANPALTATYTGFVNGDAESKNDISGSLSLSTDAMAKTPAGSYPITVSAAAMSSNNYTISTQDGTLTIGKALLTITADSKSKTYGDSNPALTVTYTGFKNNEVLGTSDVVGQLGLGTGVTASTPVGSYAIAAVQGTLSSNNYSFAISNGTMTINKATITVTADDKQRTFGTGNPALTASYNGFVNGETLSTSGIIGAPALTAYATLGSDVGTYPIIPTNGTMISSNYTFNFVKGNLTVSATNCTSSGILAVADGCYGSPFELTFYSTSGTGPFTLVINDSLYTNIVSGTPFVSGTIAVNRAESIWKESITADKSSGSSVPVEVGVKFRANVAGEASGIRFYKQAGNTGTHTGSLWSSDGTLLAKATFTGETASGWQQVSFSTPVVLTPGATYIASYYAPNGNTAYAPNAFVANRITNNTGSLTVLKQSDGGNGLFKVGAGFPDQVSADNANYFVDVVFNNTSYSTKFMLTGVISAAGCATNANTIQAVDAKMITYFDLGLEQQQLECLEASTGIITMSAYGCNGPYTYSINNGMNWQSTGSFSGLTAGSYQVKVRDAGNYIKDTLIVIGVETATWTGAINNDWHTAGNWSNNQVPTAKTHVIIGVSQNECVVTSADITAASIQVKPGAVLRVTNNRKTYISGKCTKLPSVE